jgi:hypothetical protein
MAGNKKIEKILDDVAAQSAIDREEYFSKPGATPSGWRGGPHIVYTDKKKRASKEACRSKSWE